jgi:rhamnogalacturonyl hydrolase YesR
MKKIIKNPAPPRKTLSKKTSAPRTKTPAKKTPATPARKTARAAKPVREIPADWLLEPNYDAPYGPISPDGIRDALRRIHAGLDKNTPAHVIDKTTGKKITDFSKPNPNAEIAQGAFRIISYEWGVVHAGMLRATERTGDNRYAAYTAQRLQFMIDTAAYFRAILRERPRGVWKPAFITMIHPRSLDDAGSLCASFIKADRAGLIKNARPVIDHYIDHITNKQHRLADGTLARKRPVMNSLWLDDLYMSVPALSQMYLLTGDTACLDDALRQIRQFSQRMFDPGLGLYIHGWFESSPIHPAFRWSRANAWAMLAKIELLEVLPGDHPGRDALLVQLRRHITGVASRQSGKGFWHQLIDRPDSYLETSATAIFAYCIARSINKGWIDPLAFGPVALTAWSALGTRINKHGQIEGTCIGSGMAMDPVFYYNRPQSKFAAHGYGPTLLAGSEMLPLLESGVITMHDGTVQFGPSMDMS